MELNIDTQIKTLSAYKWLTYPLLVLLFIWFSYTQILIGPGKLLDKITRTEKRISELNFKKTIRESKLTYLKLQKIETLQTKLLSLLEQMPYDHMPWELLSRLKVQGDMISFKMAENKLLQVEYKIENVEKLLELIQKLEALTPLLAINGVVYNPPLLKLEINSAFDPLQSYIQDYDRALPSLLK